MQNKGNSLWRNNNKSYYVLQQSNKNNCVLQNSPNLIHMYIIKRFSDLFIAH